MPRIALLAAGLLVVVQPAAAKAPKGPVFDRGAAASALEHVELGKCRVPTAPKGDGHVKLTFEPSGGVVQATLDSGPFVGAIAVCIVEQYKKVKVPAFQGANVTVGKTFHLR